ncbi:hypothetical protein Tco_0808751 [Tanacetum coccineum]
MELQRQLDQRQDVPTQPTQSQGIDWNDPRVLRYHALKNKPVSIAQARRNMITYLKNQGGYKESYFKKMSYNDIRPIFERVWDHVNTFIPIGSEVGKDSSKPSERETLKTVEEEKVEEKDVNPEPVHWLRHLPFPDGGEFQQSYRQAILDNTFLISTFKTLSDKGYAA